MLIPKGAVWPKAVDMFDSSGRRVGTAELSVGRATMGSAAWGDLSPGR